MRPLVLTMSYREQLDVGMTQQAVIEILGDPDEIEKGEMSEEWKWASLVDGNGKEYEARVSFIGDVTTGFCFSTPGAAPAELVISI